jgi:uncharacterized repeat protein (TIGR01451 family)
LIHLPEAWASCSICIGDPQLRLAVIDGGFDYNHEDLKPVIDQLESAPAFNYAPLHGTKVASIVAGVGGNALGVAGVMWRSDLILSGCSSPGGMLFEIACQSVARQAVDSGARVINMSQGADYDPACFPTSASPSVHSFVVEDASWRRLIDYARTQKPDKTLFVFSADNRATDFGLEIPAHLSTVYDNVMSVGAVNIEQHMASYSNYGTLSVWAPGGDQSGLAICSSPGTTNVPPSAEAQIWAAQPNNSYGFSGVGTSLAAPLVSGVAGLMLSANPNLTASQVKMIIHNTATHTDQFDPEGNEILLLDAFRAVQGAFSISAAPDLTIAKTANPNPVTSGGTLTYTITVKNIGDENADNVSVSDALPVGVGSPSCSVACSGGSETPILANLGAITAGASTSFTIAVTVPVVSASTNITNTATVSTTSTESNTANNQTSQMTTVSPAAQITVTISPKTTAVHSGETVQFTATVTGTTNTAVTWASSAGTVSSSGLYTAPNVFVSTIETLLVTSQSDTTKSDFAAVTVEPAASGFFSATGDMSIARLQHTATALSDGTTLLAGGQNNVGFLASAEIYDSAAGAFTATGSMGEARGLPTASLLPNGKVLIAGGFNSISTLASAELYDPTTQIFAGTGSMVTARVIHTATLLPSGKVLMVGGQDQNSVLLSNAELYDPSTGQFAATGSMSTPRVFHTATLLGSGKVLITGGFSVVGDVSLATAELYDPSTGTFTASTHSMIQRRTSHTATILPNGKVLIVGGTDGSISGPVLATAELYDPASDTFTLTTGSMSSPREGHTATLLTGNHILIAGGFNNDNGTLKSAELYDLGTDNFISTGSLVTGRSGHRATVLQTGKALITGGRGTAGALSSAEIYTPAR